MPFGGWLDTYYHSIYSPAIRDAGLDPHRADDLFRPSTIVNDIWEYTKKCKVVLADLTQRNPNVFYELGLAHALAKPAILIAETMEEIPFDLRALRIIVYDKNLPDWGAALRENICTAIQEVLQSPVSAVLPAFLNVQPSSDRPTVSQHEKEILEIKRELDVVRSEVAARGPMTPSRRAPTWDIQLRELRYEGKIVKRFRVAAQNQEMVLSAFEEDGWPAYIDDPLPPTGDRLPQVRLQQTIQQLNRHQITPIIHFRGNGRGDGIMWALR